MEWNGNAMSCSYLGRFLADLYHSTTAMAWRFDEKCIERKCTHKRSSMHGGGLWSMIKSYYAKNGILCLVFTAAN